MENLKIIPNKSKAGSVLLEFEESITLSNVSELKIELLDVLEKYEHFELSSQPINQIDLSGIQLIIAFAKSVERQGKSLQLNLKWSAEMQELIKKTGFWEVLNKSEK